MTGPNVCKLVHTCAQGSTITEVPSESQDTLGGNNSAPTAETPGQDFSSEQKPRPSFDLSALERKTVRGGITRFHCRYFLRVKPDHRSSKLRSSIEKMEQGNP